MGGWVDYNHNGDFEVSEYLPFTYSGTGDTLALTGFTVPTTAVLGLTGLRLRLGIDTNSPAASNLACQSEGTGETLDMLVTIGTPDCSAFPLAGGQVQGPRTYCPGTVPPVAVVSHTANAALQWQTSPDSLAWTNVSGANATQLGGPATQFADSFYVRVRVQCTSRTVYSPAVYLRPDPQLCFCTISSTSGTSSGTEVGVIRVANTLLVSRVSPRSYGAAYWFYPPGTPGNTTTLLAGVSYPLVLQQKSYSQRLQYIMGGLDANNNGRFSASESGVLHNWAQALSDSVATLTVPPTIGAAHPARLRTHSLEAWEDFVPEDQCRQTSTEIRDFLVTLAPAAPSALPLTAGTVQGLNSSGIISSCPGQRVRLTAVGYSRGAALQWQQQVGSGGAWQPIAGATGEVLRSNVLTGPTSFRLEVRLGAAGPAQSAAVLVSPTAPCPCQANLGNGYMSGSEAVIQAFALMGDGVYLLSRKSSTLPVVNGSRYLDYSLLDDSLHAYLYPGRRYEYMIMARDNPTTASEVGLWADFNRNGVFEASEVLGMQAFRDHFTVPATATPGPVRVRIRSRSFYGGTHLQAGDACTPTGDPSETEDYTFTVAPAPAFTPAIITASGSLAVGGTVQLGTREPLPTGTVLTWEGPGGFVSTQASPTLTNLTAARSGDYYLTARTASGNFQLTMARRLQIGQGLATAPGQRAAALLTLFPNPTTGLLSVRLAPDAPAYTTLRVLSSTGQLLYTQPLTAHDRATDLPLDLRAQPRGLYLVQLAGPTGVVSRKLLLE